MIVRELPWADIFRDLATHCHWTPADVLDRQTWAQFWVVWCGGGTHRKPHDPDAVRAKINRLRAAKGLPKMAPAPMKSAN